MNDHAHARLVQREVWAIPVCRYIFYIFYSCRRALGRLFKEICQIPIRLKNYPTVNNETLLFSVTGKSEDQRIW